MIGRDRQTQHSPYIATWSSPLECLKKIEPTCTVSLAVKTLQLHFNPGGSSPSVVDNHLCEKRLIELSNREFLAGAYL